MTSQITRQAFAGLFQNKTILAQTNAYFTCERRHTKSPTLRPKSTLFCSANDCCRHGSFPQYVYQ